MIIRTPLYKSLWYRFSRHGVTANQTGPEKRQRFLLNLFWLIAFIAYQFYFFLVISLTTNDRALLGCSALALLAGFGMVQFFIARKRHRTAKIMLLVLIYTGIFFYDLFLGPQAGVHLYYIPFLFVAIYLFNYKTEKLELSLFGFAPIGLYLMSENWLHSVFPGIQPGAPETHLLYKLNFTLSMVLVGLYNYFSSRIHYDTERYLDQSKINLQTLIDNTQGSIWSIDRQYRIIAANKVYRSNMKEIFGISVHSGYSMKAVIDSVTYPKEWLAHYRRVFSGESFVDEYIHQDRVFELQATPIYNLEHQLAGAAFYARDITLRKRSEQELLLAKERAEAASVAKAQFLSNMSHELRTPLNGIIGLSNILLSEQHLPSQQQFLDTLYSSADHMKHIVDDILDYNKIDAGKLTLEHNPFNLYHLLEKLKFVFAPQAEDKGLKFYLDASKDLQRNVLGDVTRLQQVLNNLLSNAIKFTDKGSVTLSVHIVERISANQCILEYSVTDTGIGIEAHKQKTVFESFTQAEVSTNRKYGGTGLGLTISKKLVGMMGGDLLLQSGPGVGSRFAFKLRTTCHHVETQPGKHKTIQSFAPFHNTEILLAEDNPVNMVVARNMLLKWNIKVTTVENGQEAVEAARSKPFDLILMDLEMPVMDGWQAVLEIRKFAPALPILAFTAASYDGLDAELAAKGINGFVHKPFRLPELHGKITEHSRNAPMKVSD